MTAFKDKLKIVGVGSVGLKLGEVRALEKLLHEDEQIGGVAYGRYKDGIAWLVATDKRLIFLDVKPLFATSDELTYDVVSGVKLNTAGPLCSVTLHTRVADYQLRYVPPKAAEIFVAYIEKRRLERTNYYQGKKSHEDLPELEVKQVEPAAIEFLRKHDLAVLSSVDREGVISGAYVYYIVDEENFIYILTKSDTAKARNSYAGSQVALTLNEPGTLETVQLQGNSEIETNQQKRQWVFDNIVKPRPYRGKDEMPPVTKLEGSYTIIKITPINARYRDYAKMTR